MDDYNLDMQTGVTSATAADDDMAAFEAEISRRLEEEHQRRAAEKAAAEQTKAEAAQEAEFTLHEVSDLPEPVPEEAAPEATAPEVPDSPESAEVPEPEPAESADTPKEPELPPQEDEDSAELSAIMQEESNRQKKHVAFAEAQDEAYRYDEEEDKGLPGVVRLIFTLLLLACGAVGVYIITVVNYESYFINTLCFAETAVCLLGALGLNTSQIANRLGQSLLMKAAALAIFLFYCLYAMQVLSLTGLLRGGVGQVDWLTMARDGISFHVAKDIAAMGSVGMAECAVFVMPFAFFVLLLVKPLRNIGLYFPAMALLIFAAGGLRVMAETGHISLAQSVVCLAGTAVAYMIFMLPPLQNVMRRSGLIGWIKVRDDD